MTPHDLLAAFETLAEAPDGIARLRELVLQLAVRGKLVPQDPNDEPACILLVRIAAEKARLAKEGKISRAKPLPPVSEDEVPFEVPEGWVWCRLSDVFLRITDGTHHSPPNGPEGDFKYITAKNIKPEGISLEAVTFVSRYMHETIYSRCNPEKGDILYIKDGATTGVVTVNSLDEPFSMLSSVCLLKTSQKVEPWYACFALRSDFFLSQMRDQMSGTGIPRVTLTKLNEAVLPIPPLPEQHRIVAKVDALMALLDHLEAARSERETTRAALRNAALAALRDAPDTDAVEAAWTRITERMDDLFTDPADVAPLRQTILQLAVRGKLVLQNPNDEPARLLLERIAVEKARLVKEGKLAKPKPLPPVTEDDTPFEVPSRWEYVRLNDLLIEDSRNGLSTQPKQGPPGIEILRISAGTARNDAVVMEEDHRFLELEEEATLTYELKRGDLLACRFNGNLHYVGRVAVYEKYSGHRQVYPDKLIRLRVHQSLINPWYIRLAMNCQGIRSVVERMCATTAGNIGISATNLKTVAIPLPPIPEQHRIVAKVDALMALCDALEARLVAAREAQAAFAAAAVHHLDA